MSIDIIDDSVFEKMESLTVALSLLSGEDNNVQLERSSAKIFIISETSI